MHSHCTPITQVEYIVTARLSSNHLSKISYLGKDRHLGVVVVVVSVVVVVVVVITSAS